MKLTLDWVSVIALLFLASIPLSARSADASAAQSTGKAEAKDSAPDAKSSGTEDQQSFLRQFSLGVGSMNLKSDEVKRASVVGGVVRVDDSSQYRNSFWLQVNWVLARPMFPKSWWPDSIRPGVWAGLEVGSENKLANGIASGIQVSFLQPAAKAGDKARSAVNIGFGWYRSGIQTLGDGVEAGKPLPAGIESVTFRQRSVTGKMWMLSLNVADF